MSRWVLVLALWWTAAAEDARRAQRAEVARVDAIKGALAEPCWAGGCASLDEALEADAPARLAAPPPALDAAAARSCFFREMGAAAAAG